MNFFFLPLHFLFFIFWGKVKERLGKEWGRVFPKKNKKKQKKQKKTKKNKKKRFKKK